MNIQVKLVFTVVFGISCIPHLIESQRPILTTNSTPTVEELQSVTLTCNHTAAAVMWWRQNSSVLSVIHGTPCLFSDSKPKFMDCDCFTPLYTCVLKSLNLSFDKELWKCSVLNNSINVFSKDIILNITGRNIPDTNTTTRKVTSDIGLTVAEKAGIGTGCGVAGCAVIAGGAVYYVKKHKVGTSKKKKTETSAGTQDLNTVKTNEEQLEGCDQGERRASKVPKLPPIQTKPL